MRISGGICRKMRFREASPNPLPARSCSGGACARNPHEVSARLVGGQVLVGIELHGDTASLIVLGTTVLRTTVLGTTALRMPVLAMTGLRSPGAQHPSTTPNRHAFPQGDFG